MAERPRLAEETRLAHCQGRLRRRGREDESRGSFVNREGAWVRWALRQCGPLGALPLCGPQSCRCPF